MVMIRRDIHYGAVFMEVFRLRPCNMMIKGTPFAETAIAHDGEIIPREVKAKTAPDVGIMIAKTKTRAPVRCGR